MGQWTPGASLARLAAEKAGEDAGGDFVGAGGNHPSPFASNHYAGGDVRKQRHVAGKPKIPQPRALPGNFAGGGQGLLQAIAPDRAKSSVNGPAKCPPFDPRFPAI